MKNWKSPEPMNGALGIVFTMGLMDIRENQLTAENYERWWASILERNVLTIDWNDDGVYDNVLDCPEHIIELARQQNRRFIGFSYTSDRQGGRLK